jgi:hypothetical protein
MASRPTTNSTTALLHPALLAPSELSRVPAALLSYPDIRFDVSADQRAETADRLRDLEPDTTGPLPFSADSSEEHDRYFGVRRISADPAQAFVHSLLVTHLEAPLDCAATVEYVPGEPLSMLFEGLQFLRVDAGLEPIALPDRSGDTHMPALDVWMAGHRLFFVLIQGATLGLNYAVAHVEDSQERSAGLRFSSTFLRSSAAAMRLASAFDPRLYDEEVRLDMRPPKVGSAFSGLQTHDHHVLVLAMKAWRQVGHVAAGDQALTELIEATQAVYDSHEFVCERFRGNDVPSLRSAALAGDRPAPSGVSVAKGFTKRRVALVTGSPSHGIR